MLVQGVEVNHNQKIVFLFFIVQNKRRQGLVVKNMNVDIFENFKAVKVHSTVPSLFNFHKLSRSKHKLERLGFQFAEYYNITHGDCPDIYYLKSHPSGWTQHYHKSQSQYIIYLSPDRKTFVEATSSDKTKLKHRICFG